MKGQSVSKYVSTALPEPFRSRLLAVKAAMTGEEFGAQSAEETASHLAAIEQITADCRKHHPELFQPTLSQGEPA